MKLKPVMPEAAGRDETERQRKRDAIARGRADVAAGRVIAHEDVERWVKSWDADTPLARPTR